MSSKSHFFRGGFNPLSLNPVIYLNASKGVNLNNNNEVTSLNDLSGNGYNFQSTINTGNLPTIQNNGINGNKSILLNGSYLENTDTYTQITDLNIIFYWLVFKLEGVPTGGYQNILIQGVFDYSNAGLNFSQLNNLNSNSIFQFNFANNNIDREVSDGFLTPKFAILNKLQNDVNYNLNNVVSQPITGTYQISNKNTFIGSWRNNNANMLFSEYGVLNYTPTQQQINNLLQYFNQKYNL